MIAITNAKRARITGASTCETVRMLNNMETTMTSILNEAELELVMGAGAAGEAVGRFIGAAASGTTPIGSGNAGNIGAAIGGKVEDKVTNACNFVVAVVKAL